MRFDDMNRERLSENAKNILSKINPGIRENPGVVTRIHFLCQEEIDNDYRARSCKDPQITIEENGTKIVYSRETLTGGYILEELTFKPEGITDVKCVGGYETAKHKGVCLCKAAAWDSEHRQIGYIDTREEFDSEERIDPKYIVATHRPEGLENLQCHESGNIMPIMYSSSINLFLDKYKDAEEYFEASVNMDVIKEIKEGQTNGKGRYASAANRTKHEVVEGSKVLGRYDDRVNLILDPELGVSSLEEYAESKFENKKGNSL